jgi:hypothetical protein
LTVKLIPTRREFSGDCGIALCFSWAQAKQAKAALVAARGESADIRQML